MAKKERRETLLSKYGIVAFLTIIACATLLSLITANMTKRPVNKVFDESIETILVQSVENVENWFANQVEIMSVFQRGIVEGTDSHDNIKRRIKTTEKPDGFDYVMVFFDDETGAKDGGPSTYNTKGGISNAGILEKEYYKQHKAQDVSVWLESPRKLNTGIYSMPLYVRSEFRDEETGKKISGGMVGFLELEAINKLGRTFFKTGRVAIYDDANGLRAGDDILNSEGKEKLLIYTRECKLANKTWTVVASVEKSEVAEITINLSRNSLVGGFIEAVILVICILIIIRIIIGKFDSIKKSIDELNTGDKDLSKRLTIFHNNEISMVKKAVNIFIEKIHDTVKQIGIANTDLKETFYNVKNGLDETKIQIDAISSEMEDAKNTLLSEDRCVNDTSTEITQITENIHSLNDMINSQATAITQASASIEEMIGNIKSVSTSIEKMSNEFDELNAATVDGIEKNRIVNELLETVLAQSKSLQETNQIISSISSQTNLLSMNAMIESAHAGEAGKGFAVVAEEIRKLADTSASQSKNIGQNLKKIAENITKVVDGANASKASFEHVMDRTNNTSVLVGTIRSAMEEQNEGSKQILEVLSAMNATSNDVQSSSREIEAGTNEVLNSISSLKASSQDMSESFSKIVRTTENTKETTEHLHELAGKMADAVNNISDKIGEFKV